MKCRSLLFVLFVCLSGLLWAQSDVGSSLPAPPVPTLPDSPENSQTLDEILNELEAILTESADSSEKVKILVTELQSKLEESRMQVDAVSTSLANSVKSLELSSKDLISLYKAQRLEVWIWRGVALVASGLLAVSLFN